MSKDEIYELFVEIKSEYPFFDVGDENFERHYRYLSDFPFEEAMKNVKNHIMTNAKRHPGIGDIRGSLGDLMDSQRSKEETDAYFAQVDLWRRTVVPPPDGYWERGRAIIRGDHP